MCVYRDKFYSYGAKNYNEKNYIRPFGKIIFLPRMRFGHWSKVLSIVSRLTTVPRMLQGMASSSNPTSNNWWRGGITRLLTPAHTSIITFLECVHLDDNRTFSKSIFCDQHAIRGTRFLYQN